MKALVLTWSLVVVSLLAACTLRIGGLGEPGGSQPVPPPPAPPVEQARVPVYDCTHWTYKPAGLLPGTQTAFLVDRAWRAETENPKSGHDLEKWKAWLRQRPQGAVIIVDEEFADDDLLTFPKETALRNLGKRLALHRTIREVRPDLVNTDVCGPLPRSDLLGPVYRDETRMKKWRESNDAALGMVREHMKALSVELYYYPTDKPVRASALEDFKAFHEANVKEARRVAGGRPVWGLVWLRTKGYQDKNWGRYVGDEMARYMLEETARTCDGIILWDSEYEPNGKWKGHRRYDPNDPALKFTLKWLSERTR